MSNRQTPNMSPNANGLIKAAQQTGRDRGASATPRPSYASTESSPQQTSRMNSRNNSQSGFSVQSNMGPPSHRGPPSTSQQAFGSHPSMSRDSIHSLNAEYQGNAQNAKPSLGNYPSLRHRSMQSASSQNHGGPSHTRESSLNTDRSEQSPRSRDNGGSPAMAMRANGNHSLSQSRQSNTTDAAALLKESLMDLKQTLSSLPGLSPDQREVIVEQCKTVARDASAILLNHNAEKEAWGHEREDFKRQLEEQRLTYARDHAPETPSTSRNSRRTATQPPSRTPTSMSSYAESSSFRKDIGGPPRMGDMPIVTASPAKHGHRNMALDLPTHTAPSSRHAYSHSPYVERPTTGAEAGGSPRSSLQRQDQHDPFAQGADVETVLTRFREPLGKLFGMAEGWAIGYASIPFREHDDLIAGRYQKPWRFMVSCLSYSNEDNATSHVKTLLRDPQSRSFFAMKMIVQYCENEIIGVKTYKNYDANIRAALKDIDRRSEERGLPTDARQRLVDERTAVINRVLASKDYNEFRLTRLDYYAKELSYLTWPLLNQDIDMTRCGKDLAAIVQLAWDMNVEQLTSGLTFQATFPEENSKFSEATMSAKDRPNDNPKKLQIEQWRVKLAITPVITVRSDRGKTIVAKSLFHAVVLLMR